MARLGGKSHAFLLALFVLVLLSLGDADMWIV
jgi:hypothetical protein